MSDKTAELAKRIKVGFAALSGSTEYGDEWNKKQCRCDPGSQEQPPFHCEYCALHDALLAGNEAITALTEQASTIAALKAENTALKEESDKYYQWHENQLAATLKAESRLAKFDAAVMPEEPEWMAQLRLAIAHHNWADPSADHSKLERVKQWIEHADALRDFCAKLSAERGLSEEEIRQIATGFEGQWRNSSEPITEIFEQAIRAALALAGRTG